MLCRTIWLHPNTHLTATVQRASDMETSAVIRLQQGQIQWSQSHTILLWLAERHVSIGDQEGHNYGPTWPNQLQTFLHVNKVIWMKASLEALIITLQWRETLPLLFPVASECECVGAQHKPRLHLHLLWTRDLFLDNDKRTHALFIHTWY